MANINGGYVSIDVTSSDLFNEIDKALLTGKPILIYGDDVPYYADEVTYDSVGKTFDIVKGGQVINVASDGTITKTGEKATPHLYRYNINLIGNIQDNTEVSIMLNILVNQKIEGNATLVDLENILGNNYDYTPVYDDNNNFTDVYFENIVADDNQFNIYIGTNGEQSVTHTNHIINFAGQLF